MLNLSGYQIHTHLYEGTHSRIYRGIRSSDNQAVIIKLLKQEYPTPAELTRYRHEYDITRNLNLDCVVQAYSLEPCENTLAIILEDFGGLSLRLWIDNCVDPTHAISLPEFLQIAIQITDGIGNIHAANIIHKDINPSNILFNPETEQVKIIDFGIATRLTRSNFPLKNPNTLEGTLAYISPEQTGRMNRSLDYRTDFYSLGVTFYELLLGQLPFDTKDSVELVHCHIAKQPLPPAQVNPEIPQPLSDIVMKLLAKNPEERYQSAWGIKADLVLCLMQLEANGVIENIVPGKNDLSDTFQIPQKLYGRKQELETLLAAFERVEGESQKSKAKSQNHPLKSQIQNPKSKIEMMLVAGCSGIGKSTLTKELYQTITEKSSYFLMGNFDPVETDIPYFALVSAFQGLVQQLLTENDAQLQGWKAKILAALGADTQVIIEVIPEVELIVGKQTALLELDAIAFQNRLSFALQNFIRLFCAKEHPLVIFLDDFQWADSATLKLIELMMTEVELHSLLLIGAYRDNEVNPTHPFMSTVENLRKKGVTVNQITLAPLALEPINQLIAQTLHRDIKSVKPLAELVVRKTGGNPCLVIEFLKTLYQENLLTFDWERLTWRWNIAQIEARDITDQAIELTIEQLKRLPFQELDTNSSPFSTSSVVKSVSDKHLTSTITSTGTHAGEILDFAAVMKATHAISSEIVLDSLLAKMMKIIIENAGAEKGFFLREKSGQWQVEVAGAIAQDEVTVRRDSPVDAQAQNSEAIAFLPNTIINYVARAQKTVVLGNAVKEGDFIQDTYIVTHQPKSILCSPIQSQGKLIGILYLENNLSTDAFTPEGLSMLNLLCSQAAISLENAQLYQELENYSRTLEEKVQERTQKLQQEIRDRKLLAKKLHTSESQIRAVFAAMSDIVLIIDREGNVEVVPTNTASSYEPQLDIIAHTIEQFFHSENAETWWRQIQRTLDTQQTINFDYSVPIGDHEFWFSAHISPRSSHSVIWVARDISDRKCAEEALRQSEEKFAKAFRSSPCAITLTSLSDGRHIEVNDSFCQFIGYSREEIIGSTTVDLNLWVNLEARKHMFQVLTQQGSIHNYEFDFRTRSGEIKTALLSAEIITFYGTSCLISVSQDISDRKRAEAALQKAKEEAEAAKKAADAASLAKSEFLANMSHELRTPLNAILGFSQLLNRSTNLNPEQQDNLSIIIRSGEHLLTLINQVLDLSKIEAGRLTLNAHHFDLYRLLDDLEDMFRLRAEDKYLQLLFERSPDVPQYVLTDEVKLRQVLINLLNNAIKFTESGGVSVRVGTTRIFNTDARINADESEGNQSMYSWENPCRALLCFEIEDTGVGIAKEELSSLFEAFVQTRSGKASQEGTGLGLAIARKFVQLMGGDITVNSEIGRGSLFKFAIEASLVDASDIQPKQPTRRVMALEPNQPRYRILIVDDRWENRQLLLKLLHPLGFEVQEASNGIEALQVWEHWQPHLIWMDMRMPVMDGYEATQRIKATTKGQATAIIALTASTLEEERAIILSAGCDDFVRKPFREVEILDTIHKHLGVRYIYDEPTDFQPKPSVITPCSFDSLPSKLLNDLKQAAIRIDMDKIDSLIDEVRSLNTALAERLAALAADFKYDEILNLIQ